MAIQEITDVEIVQRCAGCDRENRVALANLAGEHVQDAELMMAGAVLTVLPVVVVFLFFQRALERGILAGSVRG